MRIYIINVLYAFDLLVNALFGGAPHQTISARWGESPTKTWLYYWGCRVLNRIDERHCERARVHYEKIRKVDDESRRS